MTHSQFPHRKDFLQIFLLFNFLGSVFFLYFLSGCSSSQPSSSKEPQSEPQHLQTAAIVSQPQSAEKEIVSSIADSSFLEASYSKYHERFPQISREDYFEALIGKPATFCLFKDNPVQECMDFGDYENDHGRKKSAMEAYKACLLSVGYNSKKDNVRIYGSITQLYLEGKDYFKAQVFLNQLIAIDADNKWAKEKLHNILSTKYE